MGEAHCCMVTSAVPPVGTQSQFMPVIVKNTDFTFNCFVWDVHLFVFVDIVS